MAILDTDLAHGKFIQNAHLLRSQIPKEIYEICSIISREGFCLTLVGGSVRDWLLTGELGQDFDFELRHTFEYSHEEWKKTVQRLGKRLKEVYSYNIENLPFGILRVSMQAKGFKEKSIELAPARLETYKSGQSPLGHKDFSYQLVSNKPYQESFLRRDFTINAIGLEFGTLMDENEFKLIDPYNGIDDLRSRILNPCSDKFHKDPVRFARAVRFAEKLGFTLSQSLMTELEKCHLNELSKHYFLYEAGKVGFLPFFREFFVLCDSLKKFETLSPEITVFKDLLDLGKESVFNTPLDMIQATLWNLKDGSFLFEESYILKIGDELKLKRKLIQSNLALREILLEWQKKDFNHWIKNLTLDWKEFSKLREIRSLSQIRQIIERMHPENLDFIKRHNTELAKLLEDILCVFPIKLSKDIHTAIQDFITEQNIQGELRSIAVLYILIGKKIS